ncbi:MAG: hypothetical protein A2840_02050 [Candidatus Buchananbacteria bacterium RIFCSPHIGHO2_01_FULL_47_11b]|uniref:Radical SAM core domain-containing protein n=1 Tax=Candidatus Buchananbacteria bacterium RIFCSPHIGHO2_01_FULL_47_11b TaxID=1797537 RepID=A0A1G1Y7H9_9BACT|nr:MAG: hypothetical protein A2840_02050 [Candidatus Buchananbacteria bacterium RIFCSPHIGHO2_01_FULL_47_11b]
MMSRTYVQLADRAIFKSRYGHWYLIDTARRERERILIDGGAEQVLLSLFTGTSIDVTCRNFSLERTELCDFLQGLADENVIVWCEKATNSTAKCHDIDPPLDSLNALLTNTCNLRCVHCYVSSGKPMVGELTGDEWIQILQEARRLGVFELNVSGGEATLHRKFIEIAEHIASVPTFNANLNTNGILLQPEHEEVIARAFTSVQVSIDDSVATKHDQFRGRQGSFDRSVKTISRLIERGIETNIGFTLSRSNFEALDEIVTLAESLGVTMLNIGLIADLGRASQNSLVEKIGPETANVDPFMEAVYQKLKKLASRRSSVKILLPFRVPGNGAVLDPREKRFICDGDNTQILYIMANGNIMPCDKLPIEPFSYGNIRQASLFEVWTSQQMKNFKLMSPGQLPKCKACPHLKVCGGACVARAYQNGGSLDSPDWTSCVIAQKFSQETPAQR